MSIQSLEHLQRSIFYLSRHWVSPRVMISEKKGKKNIAGFIFPDCIHITLFIPNKILPFM